MKNHSVSKDSKTDSNMNWQYDQFMQRRELQLKDSIQNTNEKMSRKSNSRDGSMQGPSRFQHQNAEYRGQENHDNSQERDRKYPLLDKANQDLEPMLIRQDQTTMKDEYRQEFDTKELTASSFNKGMSGIESFRNNIDTQQDHCRTSVRNSQPSKDYAFPISHLATHSDESKLPQGVQKEVYAKPLLEDVQDELDNFLQRSFK